MNSNELHVAYRNIHFINYKVTKGACVTFMQYRNDISCTIILANATALGSRTQVLHILFCQFIEPVTFAHCAFIFALRNIALSGYLDTRRNI